VFFGSLRQRYPCNLVPPFSTSIALLVVRDPLPDEKHFEDIPGFDLRLKILDEASYYNS
jgi:hypothetical protein